jgi:hypothetical protein
MRASDTTPGKGQSADGEAESFSDRVDARVTEETRERIERVAYELSEPGSTVSESEVIRLALADYLDEIEEELGLVEDDDADGGRW